MRTKLLFGAVALAVALVAEIARASDACQGRVTAAYLFGNLLDLSVTGNTLQLLNGREDAKLKRLLEWRLVTAAADARRHIDQGVTAEASPAIPNLRAGVERGSAYVREHDLDSRSPLIPSEDIGKASANLEVVTKWLSSQR
jgi:hypothetical protein